MNLFKPYCFSLVSIIVCLLILFTTVSAEIAVVVRNDSSIENLTSEELAHIYLGTITRLSDRNEITLFELSELSEEFYDRLLHMSPIKFKKHWMKLVFSGAYASPPVPTKNQDELVTKMCETNHAIGFILADSIPKYLKAIAIDSLFPEDADYYFSNDSSKVSE